MPKRFTSLSNHKSSLYLLIFAFVMGGAGAQASVILNSPSGGYLVCVNSTTKVVTHPGTTTCPKGSKRLVLGAQGATGATGPAGAAGATGAAGAAGAAGASAPVATGTNCVGTKCTYKIGDTGPGGGLIFFVDYNDQYAGLNYLEAAPVGWGNGITVNQGSLTGETTGSSTVDPLMKWCSDTSSLLGLNAWTNQAVGAGASNTSTADTTCAGGAIQAVSDYAGGSQSDWFLPSVGEVMAMYTNLRQVGVGGFADDRYWSSSEYSAGSAWFQFFNYGYLNATGKAATTYVRPVRSF